MTISYTIVTALALYQRNDLWSVLSDNPPMWERSGSLKDEDSFFHAFFTAEPGFEDHLRCESVPMKTNALIEEPYFACFRDRFDLTLECIRRHYIGGEAILCDILATLLSVPFYLAMFRWCGVGNVGYGALRCLVFWFVWLAEWLDPPSCSLSFLYYRD